MYSKQKSLDGKVHLIDFSSEQFLDNPYRFYKERLEGGRIIHIAEGVYSTCDYEISQEVLRNRSTGRFANSELSSPELKAVVKANPVLTVIRNWMLFHNPPSHTRLRQLVARAFTPRRIADLETTMREMVTERLDDMESKGTVNFITDFAYSFPVSVISHMMGIPDEDKHLFRKWSQDFALALAMEVGKLPDTIRNRLNDSARTLTTYFENLLKKKQHNMEEGLGLDLLETLLVASEDGDSLSTEELLSNATLLLVAGHETTTNLIGNGLYALLQHPEQLQMVRDSPEIIPNMVEEVLRYDAPVQSVGRGILDDTTIFGQDFKKGEIIDIFIGGANRDPKVNHNPQTFDITRKDPKHLSFSAGIHYCLGAPLARLEAKVAFEELFDRFGSIELKQDAVRSPNWLLRGFSELQVELSR